MAALAIAAGLCVIWAMAERPVNVEAVTHFVRKVLGCDCPDEVFRSIQVLRESSAVKSCPAEYELHIGARLLIVITSALGQATSPAELERIVAEGKQARDTAHFNRFRLVVVSDTPGSEKQKLEHVFEHIRDKDEKTHLHVVHRGQVPEFFQKY